MDVIISIAIVMGSLGMILGISLAIAARIFYIETDPRQDQIENLLPGVNCGACGFTGCDRYAEAITKSKDKIEINLCTPGGEETTEAIGGIMGVKAEKREKRIAVLMCSAKNVKDKFSYSGPGNCRSAFLTQGGQKNCKYGCLGFGDCAEVCPTEAIYMDENNMPHVIEERCIACGKCAEICPKNLYQILPVSNYVHVRCKNLDKGVS
ncbi:MAG: sodium dependent NADH:ubiquinone oxidoreductase, partial [Candidatus Scalindua rubra]